MTGNMLHEETQWSEENIARDWEKQLA